MDLKPNKKGVITINITDEENDIDLSSLNNKKIKKVIINSNDNDNNIIGSKYKDEIHTGAGSDKIVAGFGNDNIYGDESGIKTFMFNKGDGNDKLYDVKTGDNIVLNIADSSFEDVKYSRSGKNLIVTYIPQIKTKKKITQKSDSITLVNFFDNEQSENIASLTLQNNNGSEVVDLTELQYSISGKGKLYGSSYNDKITGSKKSDTIYTKSGNDEITPGKGNDKIYIDGSGNKTINISNGGGKDTVIMCGEGLVNYDTDGNPVYDESVKVNLYFDETAQISYRTDGEDLFIDRTFKSGKKTKTETLTVENLNLYNPDSYVNNVFIDGVTSLKDALDTTAVFVVGEYDKEEKYTNYYGLSDYKNIITYNTKGNAWLCAGIKNDIYNIKAFNKNMGVVEVEDYGGEDTVNINTNAENLRAIFNVDKDGNVVYTKFEDEQQEVDKYWYNCLSLFDKSKMTLDNYKKLEPKAKGVIALSNYFMTWDDDYNQTANINTANIEHIKDNQGNDLLMSTAVNLIANRVSEVLTGGITSTGICLGVDFENEYTSAYDVMENGTTQEKTEILNIYKNTQIGTDGNNSFTSTTDSTKYWTGTTGNDVFVAGKGDDTFTFSGKFGDDVIYSDTESDENGNVINTDTLVFKDYAFTNGNMNFNLDGFSGYGSDTFDLRISCYYSNKKTHEYGVEQRVTYKNFLEPTFDEVENQGFENIKTAKVKIKDKTATYDLDYRHLLNGDEGDEVYKVDYSDEVAQKGKTNVKVLFLDNESVDGENLSKNEIISSSVGYHYVSVNNHVNGIGGETTFNYKGGHDQYLAKGGWTSDTYNIDVFDKNSDLFIFDCGGENDTLNFTNTDVNDLRILFNVYSDGTVGHKDDDYEHSGDNLTMSIFHKNRFNMKDMSAMMSNDKRQGVIQIGEFYQTNTYWDEEQEQLVSEPTFAVESFNAKNSEGVLSEFDMELWMSEIAENVSGWLRNNGKTSTWDAIENIKNTSKLNELLQLFNVSYDSINNG